MHQDSDPQVCTINPAGGLVRKIKAFSCPFVELAREGEDYFSVPVKAITQRYCKKKEMAIVWLADDFKIYRKQILCTFFVSTGLA